MTGKAARITLWPTACQVLGALLDQYESNAHCCFEEDSCEYVDDCDNERSSKCKHARQLDQVRRRLHKGGYP